jgi:thiamine kinase-like enzyme
MRTLEETEKSRIRESFLDHKEFIGLNNQQIETGLSFEILSGGSSNVNYKVKCSESSKEFFVKNQTVTPISKHYANNLEREYTVFKYLSNPTIGLTPKPYFLDIKRKVLVAEFISGYHPTISNKDIGTILRRIGLSISKFRSFPIELLQFLNTNTRICPHDFFHKIIRPSIHQLVTQGLVEGSSSVVQFLEEIQAILLRRLEIEPKIDCEIDWNHAENSPSNIPYGLIHNDLAFRNILVRPNNQLIFIDFEFADFGDLAYDLAYLISENQLLFTQTKVILQNIHLNPRILDRTNRYIKIFLPLLELANAHWTLSHISKIISGDPSVKLFQLPSSIAQNLQYVRWKIRRLASILHLKSSFYNEDQIFFEIQNALKIFEAQISIT